jgi:hypothetical protein
MIIKRIWQNYIVTKITQRVLKNDSKNDVEIFINKYRINIQNIFKLKK